MGFLQNQLSNVVEWNETNPNVICWKWSNQELKKGSVLFIRPGQQAIFLYNGRVEGIFEDEGRFDIESQIIPFLSTLKGFKFGFNSGIRAEVLFINKKEILCKWGTKNPINLPMPNLPGGMPIRAFGTYNCKISDYMLFIEKMVGIKTQVTTDDIRDRVIAMLDQYVMKWIATEGKDMFNLQMYSVNIAKGVESDIDMEMRKVGISIIDFTIESFSYPEQVKAMQEKAAAQAMVGDMGKYTQMAMADNMSNGRGSGSGIASDMVNMQMGMMMGQQMMGQMMGNNQMMNNQMMNNQAAAPVGNGTAPKFCPECGTPTNGAKFCPNCGNKLV